MIELTSRERNKVYVNDKAIILDKDTVTASELLEIPGLSSLVYDIYLAQNGRRKSNKKKDNKPIEDNKKISQKQLFANEAQSVKYLYG